LQAKLEKYTFSKETYSLLKTYIKRSKSRYQRNHYCKCFKSKIRISKILVWL